MEVNKSNQDRVPLGTNNSSHIIQYVCSPNANARWSSFFRAPRLYLFIIAEPTRVIRTSTSAAPPSPIHTASPSSPHPIDRGAPSLTKHDVTVYPSLPHTLEEKWFLIRKILTYIQQKTNPIICGVAVFQVFDTLPNLLLNSNAKSQP